jgi:cytochrome c oxidase assembly protein subunit 15
MKYSKAVIIWLWIGLFMVFMQIVIGGITRLTGSGLSITKWEIVTGSIPPVNHVQWDEAFELYKATPQYEKINEGMTMSQFKFIYFWEFIHRLWARFMGFVFLIPFLIFQWKKMLDGAIRKDLLRVVSFAFLAAIFGWIMVASGLVNRPWVNAYKLSIHLAIGFSVFAALWWTILRARYVNRKNIKFLLLKKPVNMFISLLIIQILLGGLMSGMKAGLFYNTWPVMDNGYFPQIIFHSENWSVNNMIHYDRSPFMSAIIQLLHRTVAYILFGFGIFIVWKLIKQHKEFILGYSFLAILFLQITLGILTLINCIGVVPVFLGVLHQAGGLLLLAATLYLMFIIYPKKPMA